MRSLYFYLLSLFLVSACSGGGGGSGGGGSSSSVGEKIHSLDLSNTSSLIITSDAISTMGVPNGANAFGASELQKVTTDGRRLPVKYKNKEGNEIVEKPVPNFLKKVSSQYLLLGFTDSTTLLVDSVSGAAYALSKATGDLVLKDENIFNDSNGNLYLLSMSEKLIKVDLSDISNPSALTYSVSTDAVQSFCVDDLGNAGYFGFDMAGNSVMRFIKYTGGYEILPGASNYERKCWRGVDGDMMFFNGFFSGLLKKIIFDGLHYAVSNYGTNVVNAACGWKSKFEISGKAKVMAIGGCTYIFELENPSNEVRNIPISNFNLSEAIFGSASTDYYYIFGTNTSAQRVLLKVNPDNDSFSTVFAGQYDIYKMTISPSDEIIFNGLRLSDGATVLGQISPSGTISIIDESLTSEVQVLERIN